MNDFVIENSVLKKYIGSDGDVVIPECVVCIDTGVFECHEWLGNKVELKSITLPDGLKSIGSRAFCGCKCLQRRCSNV